MSLPDGSGTNPEPAYDAWAVHDEGGVVVTEGRRDLGPPEPLVLSAEEQWRIAEETARLVLESAPAIHPEIERLLTDGDEGSEISVLVAIRASKPLRLLPRFREGSDRFSPENVEVLAERARILNEDAALRREDRAAFVERARELGAAVFGEYAAGNIVSLRLRAGALKTLLAEHEEIAAVSPAELESRPAGFATILTARTRAQTDYLVSAGYNGAGRYIGLLDTGTKQTHRTLAEPDKILFWRDCASTILADCTATPLLPYNPDDAYAPGTGHGTAMANILVGGSAIGDAYRGVAPGAGLDSANVYSGTSHDTVSSAAVVRALNWLDFYDDVIVANVDADEQPNGPISLAADDLYAQGVIVVAPVGNCAVCYSGAPANAHKVLGVSGYYSENGNEDYGHSNGMYGDDRLKPDLAAPTLMWAAATYNIGGVAEFGGTCTAAASAGGAATILRHYYDYRGWSADPGAIYAAMINFGDDDNPDNTDGAGNLAIGPLSNTVWMSGVRYLSPNQSTDVPLAIPSGACNLRAAIWWAEDYTTLHDIMILQLYEGSTKRESSLLRNGSVFQKIVYPYSLSAGSWTVRITSYVGNHQQNLKVHYAIHYRTNC
ncbi:MAG: S8 family serine peptidase [Myxococcales bacterium]|nr:S8 family serine peptidase [Myxococcales bacterium]